MTIPTVSNQFCFEAIREAVTSITAIDMESRLTSLLQTRFDYFMIWSEPLVKQHLSEIFKYIFIN